VADQRKKKAGGRLDDRNLLPGLTDSRFCEGRVGEIERCFPPKRRREEETPSEGKREPSQRPKLKEKTRSHSCAHAAKGGGKVLSTRRRKWWRKRGLGRELPVTQIYISRDGQLSETTSSWLTRIALPSVREQQPVREKTPIDK